jgi:hypothetical protein
MGGRRQWAKTESNRITVAECSACPIWIIAKRRCSIALDHQRLAASTSMPLTNLLPGTAPSLGSLSTVSSSFATACTWNQEGWPRTPSTSNSQPCAVSHTRLPTQACSVPHFLRHRDRVENRLVDDKMYRGGHGRTVEDEADALAADLLMPRRIIGRFRAAGLNSVEQLAAKFDVSVPAMKHRLGIRSNH